MVFALLAASTAFMSPFQSSVKLNRTFAKGEKGEYEVKSSINSESRFSGLETWMPEDFDFQYRFTYEVTAMKADGICEMRYKRPTITEIEGETVDSQPKRRIQKLDWDLSLTVSPINELLNVKDLAKKPDVKKPPPKVTAILAAGGRAQDPIGDFISEVHRLALFVGSLDSSLDFSPKLPFDEVKIGDTWKRTVGYSPQKLRGKGDKVAVQRLDYTFTYRGLVDSDGTKVQRVTADLELKTDLATFIHQTFDLKPSESGLKEIPLSFKATVDYDLDPKTHKTLRASAQSSGEFRIVSTYNPDQPVVEERFKGRTTMRLLLR